MTAILHETDFWPNFGGILKRRLSGLAGNHAFSFLAASKTYLGTGTDVWYAISQKQTKIAPCFTYQAKIIIFARYLLGKDNYLCPIGVTQHRTSDPSGKDNYLWPIPIGQR